MAENFVTLGSVELSVDDAEANAIAERVATQVRQKVGEASRSIGPQMASRVNAMRRGGGLQTQAQGLQTIAERARVLRSGVSGGVGQIARGATGGLAGFAIAAIGIGAAVGLAKLIRGAIDSSKVISALQAGATVNNQVALAKTILEVGNIRRLITSSQRVGATSIFRADALDRLLTTLEPITSALTNLGNLVSGAISRTIDILFNTPGTFFNLIKLLAEKFNILAGDVSSTLLPFANTQNLRGIAGINAGDTVASQFIFGAIAGGLNPRGGVPTPPTNVFGPVQFRPMTTF